MKLYFLFVILMGIVLITGCSSPLTKGGSVDTTPVPEPSDFIKPENHIFPLNLAEGFVLLSTEPTINLGSEFEAVSYNIVRAEELETLVDGEPQINEPYSVSLTESKSNVFSYNKFKNWIGRKREAEKTENVEINGIEAILYYDEQGKILFWKVGDIFIHLEAKVGQEYELDLYKPDGTFEKVKISHIGKEFTREEMIRVAESVK